jgi:two-component system nitrate/nitrite response regulator NarL
MLTTSTDESDLRDCLKYGAQGYLLKDMDPDELVYALNEIRIGSIIVRSEERRRKTPSITDFNNFDGRK